MDRDTKVLWSIPSVPEQRRHEPVRSPPQPEFSIGAYLRVPQIRVFRSYNFAWRKSDAERCQPISRSLSRRATIPGLDKELVEPFVNPPVVDTEIESSGSAVCFVRIAEQLSLVPSS